MTMDPAFKIPASYRWSASLEREVGFKTLVSVAYVGSVAVHLERERNLNPLPIGTLQRPENQGIEPSALRPYRGFAIIALGENAARSEYNAFQLEVNRRFINGFSYGLSYTYSKSEDNASRRGERVWNPFDDRSLWGPSTFDSRHVAVVNFIYELPLLRSRKDWIGKTFGRWQIAGSSQFQTGIPFTVGTGDDFAGIGATGENQPWNMLGDPKLPHGDRRFSQGAADQNFYLRTKLPGGSSLFTAPAAGTFTTSQTRNTVYNAGSQNWNLGASKDFLVTEKQRIQVRTEWFNFPNHPNWASVDTNPRNSTFGKVTAKNSERNVQFGLRYTF